MPARSSNFETSHLFQSADLSCLIFGGDVAGDTPGTDSNKVAARPASVQTDCVRLEHGCHERIMYYGRCPCNAGRLCVAYGLVYA